MIWINNDPVSHTSTSGVSPNASGLWDTGNIDPGRLSTTVFFTARGSFPYFCTIHPFMTATVTVQ